MPNLNRDDEGRVVPYDDDSIDDDDLLIRRIPNNSLDDNSDGSRRVSSGAFSRSSKIRDHYRSMSVDLLSDLLAAGTGPREENYYPDFEVIMSLRVGDIRAAQRGFRIGRLPSEGNPAHCGVWNVSTLSKQKALKEMAEFVRNPGDVTKDKR